MFGKQVNCVNKSFFHLFRREKAVQDLILSYEKYEELLAKSQKGVEYYKNLLENVTRTLERCQSECKVRQEERDMLLTKLAPKGQ